MSKKVWGVSTKKRNYVQIWIFLLLLCSVNFFDIIPIVNLLGVNGSFAFFLLSLFFMFTFYRRYWIKDVRKWLKPFWWFYAGIVLSFIPALLYYGQSFVQSFFTNRRLFELVAFPILIALRPSERELRNPFLAFSVLYLFLCLFLSYVAPQLLPHEEGKAFIEDGDYVHALPGIRLVFIGFVFEFCRAVKNPKAREIALAVFVFAILFLVQNRTTLMAALIVAAYTLYSMRMGVRKIILMLVVIAAALLMVVYLSAQWELLYQETLEQVTNPEYNRNKAFVYMFSSREPLRYLLGDGFISANVNPIIHDLQEQGIYHSDVGLIGMWHQYGVIPVIVVLVVTFKGLFRRKSLLIRTNALYTLVGTFTISFFGFSESLLWLSVYLYLYYAADLPQFVAPASKRRLPRLSTRPSPHPRTRSVVQS